MKLIIGQVIFLLSIMITPAVFATHIISGELTYRCTGGNVYEVTLSVYTECGSQAVLEEFYPIQYYATSLNISPDTPLSFNVTKSSTSEVQLLCVSAVTDCNGGTARGVELVVYKGLVNLSSFERSSDWRFFWQRASRSEEISTLLVPSEEDFFVEASLNNLYVDCNSSVTFGNLALAITCINQEYVFNNAATDPNGDVLKYSLITPKSSHDTDVIFDSNFSATNFLSLSNPAQLDEDTGDLSFTADMLAVGITDFKVEEYRNGVLVGWVRRGLQFTAIDCNNSLPTLSSFNETSTSSVSVCVGSQLNVTLGAIDSDNDQLSISLLSGRSDFFSIVTNDTTNPSARIFSNTVTSNIGEHQFVVRVTDNVCPDPGVETKTYTVIVRENVSFSLGNDVEISCSATTTLSPTVTGGDGNYTYLWSDGSTGPTIQATIGDYELSVTDGSNCSFSDEISITGEFAPSFSTSSLCAGQVITFTDNTSTVSNTKSIVDWLWDFGDGSTSSDQHPTHTYTNLGAYQVTLVVTDNGSPACSYTTTEIINICEAPLFDFSTSGYCNYDLIELTISPSSNRFCDVLRNATFDYGDGTTVSTCSFCLSSRHAYQTPGIYTITVTGSNQNGCQLVLSKDLEIFASPEVNIIPNDFTFDCSNPTTSLNTQITTGGEQPITYSWNTGETTANITINEPGVYAVIATDAKGCSFSDGLTVTYPLVADFSYTPVCDQVGDQVSFMDRSNSLTNTVDTWLWDFGDGSTSSDQHPTHTFSTEGSFLVTLQVTDDDGCTHTASDYVRNVVIESTYTTLRYNKNNICLGEPFIGIGPDGSYDPVYFWSFGDGTTSSEKNPTYNYPSSGQYNVSLEVSYNKALKSEPSSCSKVFQDLITVSPLPVIEILSTPERFCLNEEITFSYQGSSSIQSVIWKFTNTSTNQEDISTQVTTKYTFTQRTRYHIELTATDNNGCSVVRSYSQFIDGILIPDFQIETNVCAKEYITFEESFQDLYENITNYHWDFGDGQTQEGLVPIPLVTHKYEAGGTYEVILTVSNSFSNCNNAISKMVNILLPPKIDFSYDVICQQNTMTFENKTTKGDGNIESYRWVFPDGSETSEENTSYYFEEPGRFPVSLISTSDLRCSDTLTQEVYVRSNPKASIELPDSFIEAFIPHQFYDNSDAGEEATLTSYFWNFGDNTTSLEQNPIHTYKTIERYPLTHAVTNSLNCSDTTSLLLDLSIYVELPNTFTPNSDGANDYLKLIQQGVHTLNAFRVYNRQGKLVFDGGGNIEAQWDGTFNSQPQPIGVYVTQIEALDVYGNKYNFKKNITLLR